MFFAFTVRLRRASAAVLILALTLCAALLWQRGAQTASAGESIALPILMYHSVVESGAAGDYVVTRGQFYEDLKYLAERGYTAILPTQLARFIYDGEPLPEKPFMITLDDGYLNGATVVLPVLEELSMKAVISVVGDFTDRFTESGETDPAYAHMTWKDIAALAGSGCVEIGNHTYSMHYLAVRRGCARKYGESEAEYRAALRADLTRLQEVLFEKSGASPIAFAYPYGFKSEGAREVLEELGFLMAFDCEEKVNYLTGAPGELFELHRFNRPSWMTTEQYMANII